MRLEVLSYGILPECYKKGMEYILINEDNELGIYTSYKIRADVSSWIYEMTCDELYFSPVTYQISGNDIKMLYYSLKTPLGNRHIKNHKMTYRRYDVPF